MKQSKTILIFITLLPTFVIGQDTLFISDGFERENIGAYTYLWEDVTAEESIEQVMQKEGVWQKHNDPKIIKGVSYANFWTRYTITNTTPQVQHLALVETKPLLDKVQFFCLENGVVVDSSLLMGDMQPFFPREVNHRYYIHIIHLPAYKTWDVYSMVGKNGGKVSSHPMIFQQNHLVTYLHDDIIYRILLIVLIVVTGLLGLVYFVFSGKEFALLFFLQNSCGVLFLLANDGLGFQYIWPNLINIQLGAPLFFTVTYYLFQALFTISFFDIRKNTLPNKLLRAGVVLQTIATLGFFLPLFFAEPMYWASIKPLGYLMTINTLLTNICIMTACTLYYLWSKDKNMLLFIASIFVPIFMGILTLSEWLTIFQIPKMTLFEVMAISGTVQNLIVLFIAIRVYHHKDIAEKNLQIQLATKQNEALQNLLKGQEIERKRLSRDLHDGLSLRVVQFKSDLGDFIKKASPNILESKGRLMSEIDEVHRDIRNFSHALHPTVLQEYGLKKAISGIIAKMEINDPDLDIQFNCPEPLSIGKERETHFYHIVQELLNNTLKYADANKIIIDFTMPVDDFQLIYFDNGIGYDYKQMTKQGIGLKNIQSRVDLMGGLFEIKPVYPKGIEHKIRTAIPLSSN